MSKREDNFQNVTEMMIHGEYGEETLTLYRKKRMKDAVSKLVRCIKNFKPTYKVKELNYHNC